MYPPPSILGWVIQGAVAAGVCIQTISTVNTGRELTEPVAQVS